MLWRWDPQDLLMVVLRVIRKRIKHDSQVCGQSSLEEQWYPFLKKICLHMVYYIHHNIMNTSVTEIAQS